MAGDLKDLLEYIADFDLQGVRVPSLTASEWNKILPSWKTREKERGLKEWSSNAGKGAWTVPGVCAKPIQNAIDIYVGIFGVPPVVEGAKVGNVLQKKDNGMDLFKPFVITVGYLV